jgi:beta-1,4-N-acetylglucosaminyltransferase
MQSPMLASFTNAQTTGSGSILDALRTGVPIIVVPNETLLDNHQVELAEALAEQEYVVHGRLAQLPQALADAEKLRQRSLEWPPVNSGPQRGMERRRLEGEIVPHSVGE